MSRKKDSKLEKDPAQNPQQVLYPLGPPGTNLRGATNMFYSMAKTLGAKTWIDGEIPTNYKYTKNSGDKGDS
ncbi:MAG: hypothetical protein ABIH59_01905 [archaeon]